MASKVKKRKCPESGGASGKTYKRLSIREAAFMTGADERIIRRMLSFELISPVPGSCGDECFFDEGAIPRLKKLLRLHYDLGVSWTSMELVLDLLERIEELEARNRRS